MGVKVGVEIRNLPLVRSRSHACLAARRIAGLAGWNRGSSWRSLSSCCSCCSFFFSFDIWIEASMLRSSI